MIGSVLLFPASDVVHIYSVAVQVAGSQVGLHSEWINNIQQDCSLFKLKIVIVLGTNLPTDINNGFTKGFFMD